MEPQAVAVFNTRSVKGDVTFTDMKAGLLVEAVFTKLPPGEHGFHIHKAGDLRGDGCKLACEHFHKGDGPSDRGVHGGPPKADKGPPSGGKAPRHTGDLGNVSLPASRDPIIRQYKYTLRGVKAEELWGRSVIVHEDPDDLGLGEKEDSLTTGHSGRRIACAVIGRTMCQVE
jgi:Cu-Zn family superoxide dismutase